MCTHSSTTISTPRTYIRISNKLDIPLKQTIVCFYKYPTKLVIPFWPKPKKNQKVNLRKKSWLEPLQYVFTVNKHLKSMNEQKLRRMIRQAIKENVGDDPIQTLLQQVEDMAFKGQIGTGEEGTMTRDELAHEVSKAVRRGRSKFDRSQPDYADRQAASREKAAATRAASAERSKELGKQFAAQRQADDAAMQARRDNNQLPLRYDTAFTDIESRIGDLARYYDKRGVGTDSEALVLKPQFVDRSFSDEVIAKAWLK
jgi:hypothetical protein